MKSVNRENQKSFTENHTKARVTKVENAGGMGPGSMKCKAQSPAQAKSSNGGHGSGKSK